MFRKFKDQLTGIFQLRCYNGEGGAAGGAAAPEAPAAPEAKDINDITKPSRKGSIGGLVTWAKSCLK